MSGNELERRPAAEAATPDQVLALIGGIRADLAAVEDPREAVSITKRADAVKYLASKADASAEVQNQAAEVALRSRRRAGQLLADIPRETGGRPPKNSPTPDASSTPYQRVLEESNLPKPTAEKFQQLARLREGGSVNATFATSGNTERRYPAQPRATRLYLLTCKVAR